MFAKLIIENDLENIFTYRIYSNKRSGALQFRGPNNDILKKKCKQIHQNFNALKLFCMAFGHYFPIKSGRERLLERGVY